MVLGNVILAGAVVVTLGVLTIMLKVDEVKRNSRRIIGDATKEVKKISDDMKHHREDYGKKIEELYANAEKVLNKEYAEPLADNEIEMLNDLLQRAKRDDRFKDNMEKMDFWFITYESILASCRSNKRYSNEIKHEMESDR